MGDLYDLGAAIDVLSRTKERVAPGAHQADKKQAAQALVESVLEAARKQGYTITKASAAGDVHEWSIKLRENRLMAWVVLDKHAVSVGSNEHDTAPLHFEYDPPSKRWVAPGTDPLAPDAARSAPQALAAAIATELNRT